MVSQKAPRVIGPITDRVVEGCAGGERAAVNGRRRCRGGTGRGGSRAHSEQGFEQGFAGAGDVELGARAADDAADADALLDCLAAARPPGHERGLAVRLPPTRSVRPRSAAALRLHRLDPLGDRRRDAMAVDVPPGPQVADEAMPLVGGGRSPHTCWVTGRSSWTASRQPISRAAAHPRSKATQLAGKAFGPSTTGSRRR